MKIITIKVGSLQTNCYIVIDQESKHAVVIDPGDEANKILPELKGLIIDAIVITHGHPDHFGALDEIKKTTHAPIMMHQADNWFINPDKFLNDGDELSVGQIKFKVIHTPGHSSGGICLYTPGHLFSGDTLFWGTHGRTDLPGSSFQEMKKSLSRLGQLPNDTIVYPGHDETTTIGREKENATLAS